MQMNIEAFERIGTFFRGRLIGPYQTNGVRWMLSREDQNTGGLRGGILADQMGLGKTIQVLACVAGHPSPKPTLVVCPKSLIDQWRRECKKFLGIDALVVTTHAVNNRLVSAKDIETARIVITAYPTIAEAGVKKMKLKALGDNPLLEGVEFHRVVFDEAHNVKNKNCGSYKNALRIRADIRWGLTGTPITRKKRDLAAILGVLGGCGDEPMRSLVLRRTLEDVAQVAERLRLPPCLIQTVNVDFSPEETEAYESLKLEGSMLLAAYEATEGRRSDGLGAIIEVVTRMRQMCSDPQMVHEGRGDGGEFLGVPSKRAAVVAHVASQTGKTVVFTHWNRELSGIVADLEALGIETVQLNGRMNSEDRNESIERFCEAGADGCDVLVSHIEVGGVGLNLQAAQNIVIASPAWNAASELQCIGRAHRTGVEHVVKVYRFVVSDTIDEYILGVQQQKLDAAAEVLEDARISASLNGVSLKTVKAIFE